MQTKKFVPILLTKNDKSYILILKLPKLKGAPDSKGINEKLIGQLALFKHFPPFCCAKGSYFYVIVI